MIHLEKNSQEKTPKLRESIISLIKKVNGEALPNKHKKTVKIILNSIIEYHTFHCAYKVFLPILLN